MNLNWAGVVLKADESAKEDLTSVLSMGDPVLFQQMILYVEKIKYGGEYCKK